jgi:hypothetical protein
LAHGEEQRGLRAGRSTATQVGDRGSVKEQNDSYRNIVVRQRIFGGMVGQMNGARRQNGPDGLIRQGLTGHSPALARLFLVGLRPRRARLRFTG